jgi:hypothetical protein
LTGGPLLLHGISGRGLSGEFLLQPAGDLLGPSRTIDQPGPHPVDDLMAALFFRLRHMVSRHHVIAIIYQLVSRAELLGRFVERQAAGEQIGDDCFFDLPRADNRPDAMLQDLGAMHLKEDPSNQAPPSIVSTAREYLRETEGQDQGDDNTKQQTKQIPHRDKSP